MADKFSAYINARVRGMKSALLSQSELDGFMEAGSPSGIADGLLQSPYDDEMAESLSRYEGVEAVEDAVSRNLVHTFARLRGMCREEDSALAELFIGRWDLIAVKSLLRNRHHGLDAETGAGALFPSPSMPQAVQKELASLDSMDALVRGLSSWNGKLCGVLVEGLGAYQDEGGLRALEEALDRNYFVSNIRRLERYSSADARFIQGLLRAEIDRINLRRLFEPRPSGVEAEDVLAQMLPRGILSDQVLRDIATSPSPDRAAEVVGRSVYGDMADALAAFSQTGTFSVLERQFELQFMERLKRAAQKRSVGLAVLLRYAWLKYNEVMNLRIIAHGLAAHLPRERVMQEILYV